MNFPPDFQTRINQQLGEDAPAFWETLTQQPAREGLRVNTLKISAEDFRARSPFPLSSLPWTKSGFLLGQNADRNGISVKGFTKSSNLPNDLPNRSTPRKKWLPGPPGKHPYHAAGMYYLQEPSAMAVAEILDPQPGERVLDLAAAPGGKATHIAALMKNKGFLLANDPHKGRAQALARNLERWGATNTAITTEMPERLATRFGPFFDRVLVDAPCSGEGMFRKSHREREQWTPNLVERCAAQQDSILWHAAQLVRPGGILVYATCTFSPLEDEGSIARFVEKRPDFELKLIPKRGGLTPGRPNWGNGEPMLHRTARLWPHLLPGEGHFIAKLQQLPKITATQPAPNWQPQALTKESQQYYKKFFKETLHAENVPTIIHPSSERLAQLGNRLYAIPAYGRECDLAKHCPDLRGLSIVHWGWWLGTFKTKRFEPSHALAMALSPKGVKMTLSLSAEDHDTIGYIRGLPFRSSGAQGWLLVTVEGYPLGWGKRVQNRVRSHSPRWLRG